MTLLVQLHCIIKTANRLAPTERHIEYQSLKHSIFTPQVNARSEVGAERSSERVAGWRLEGHAQTESTEEERRSAMDVIREPT